MRSRPRKTLPNEFVCAGSHTISFGQSVAAAVCVATTTNLCGALPKTFQSPGATELGFLRPNSQVLHAKHQSTVRVYVCVW